MPPEAPTRRRSYADALREALLTAMERDPSVFVVGEGVPDPGGIFGTTRGLRERFGSERVRDMPISEGAMTGVALGAALAGLRPVVVHQRMDFLLLALDQLLNNAAKWRYMFGGRFSAPLTVRAIVGRGWGQGPQHSQSLQALLAHVPGLEVVLPATPADARGMLLAAIEDPDPVVVVEHRWLYGLEEPLPATPEALPLRGARIRRTGRDATLAALSYMVVEALEVADRLAPLGIDLEVVDLRCATALDLDTLAGSVRRTGRLCVLDTAWTAFGISAEVVAAVAERCLDVLVSPPVRIGLPRGYPATSPHLAARFYPTPESITEAVLDLVGARDRRTRREALRRCRRRTPADVPHASFSGPF